MEEMNWDDVGSETQDKVFDAVHMYCNRLEPGFDIQRAIRAIEEAYRQMLVDVGVGKEIDRREKAAKSAGSKASLHDFFVSAAPAVVSGGGSLESSGTAVINATSGYVSFTNDN